MKTEHCRAVLELGYVAGTMNKYSQAKKDFMPGENKLGKLYISSVHCCFAKLVTYTRKYSCRSTHRSFIL